jgi:prepilin-type processing-associated H-X9-DG protein/prepilin-type N-terminal cleavage/methylation domain-containing protein
MYPRRGQSKGFTLIELLIVFGLIAVLVGLFLPVLSRTRRASNQVGCVSNLRQWGLAMQAYALGNNGYLPRRGQGVQPTNQIARPQDWFNVLPPMFKLKPYVELVNANEIPRPGGPASVWVCPEAQNFPGQYYWSYGMNMGLSVEQGSQNLSMPDRLTGAGDSSTMVIFADAPGNYCAVFPSRFAGGYNPVARHNDHVNICFLDGHAAAFLASDIGIGTGLVERPDIRWHPPNSTWNSAP